jgi:hypothetical protein
VQCESDTLAKASLHNEAAKIIKSVNTEKYNKLID